MGAGHSKNALHDAAAKGHYRKVKRLLMFYGKNTRGREGDDTKIL
jgi:hypothetical protein